MDGYRRRGRPRVALRACVPTDAGNVVATDCGCGTDWPLDGWQAIRVGQPRSKNLSGGPMPTDPNSAEEPNPMRTWASEDKRITELERKVKELEQRLRAISTMLEDRDQH